MALQNSIIIIGLGNHYSDVIISATAFQIAGILIVCSGADQRKWKLHITGLCAGILRSPVDSPHKGPVTQKMFP